MSNIVLCTQETITIDTTSGPEKVPGHRLGDFAVHCRSGTTWRITHLPTGCAIARGFEPIENAVSAMADIMRLRNDWSVLSTDDITPELKEKVCEIAAKHGGYVGVERDQEFRRRFDFNGYADAR